MRVLVIGGGGREHALVWKIAQSPLVEKIYCVPGNAGIAQIAECVALKPTEIDTLADFAEAQNIGLTVVGPEGPLAAGIVDVFEARGLKIFGPSADPARIESSKAFARQLMQSANIPSPEFWVCDTPEMARIRIHEYFVAHGPDAYIVIKADGLAAGKGVIVAQGEPHANEAVERIMGARVFGASGDRVVIEEYLEGEEASIMAITDGKAIVPLLVSQDHKRAFDGDTGPNTGGMGAYAPVPILPGNIAQETVERIIKPAVEAIYELGIPYQGVLYAGIMVTKQGVKTIEFNCRFGDPETQVVLPMLESDLVPLLLGAIDGTLEEAAVKWRGGAAVGVVAASGGYPGDYETGKPISGLEALAPRSDSLVFHSGTRLESGQVLTEGGRVLTVTGLGDTLLDAAAHAYDGLGQIHFDGIYYRKDIATRALQPR
jgi:phosphoribosylamine---glycine ligase